MCCVNAPSRWSCIWVSFTRLRWRHSLDEGVNQWGRLFKAKESDRSSRVNEYAVCCHALFLYPAVVQRREGEKLFLDQGSLAAPAPTATNDADYMKHMLFPPHKHTLSHFSRVFRLCTAPRWATSVCIHYTYIKGLIGCLPRFHNIHTVKQTIATS